MVSVLLRAVSFMFIIALGAGLHRAGALPENAGETIKKIMINVTLPAAIVVNFAGVDSIGGALLAAVVLGVASNAVMLAVGILVSRRREKSNQALMLLCLPAFNIGAFALPFVQSFLPTLGGVATCMFDVGNSVMCTGVNNAFTAEYVSVQKSKIGIAPISFLKRLLKSVPLDTYVLMFVLGLFGLQMPAALLTLIDPIAKANTFVAMLMLGLLFHVEFKAEYLKEVAKIVGLRHLFAVCFGAAVWFLLPVDPVIRQALVLAGFAPMSAVAPAYTDSCGGDGGLASCANSVTIVCSLAEVTALLMLMGLC